MILTLFTSASALAWVTPPVLVPADPVAGQPVFVAFSYGYCDVFFEPSLSQQGTDVHLVIYSAHNVDDAACIYQPQNVQYPIGSYAAGSYTVQVDRTFYGDNGLEQHPMATLSMIVAAAPGAEPVPALGLAGLLGLVLALLLASWIGARVRLV